MRADFPQVGGNMPGRGLGERLAVDPKLPSVLYFGARSGNGLWKCEPSVYFMLISMSEFTDAAADYGVTWSKVTSFTWPGVCPLVCP